MKFFSTLGNAALLASVAISAPLEKRAVSDVDYLQFVLTIEHMENVFYKQGLQKFSNQTFFNAGFTKEYYTDILYIAHTEEAHVVFLENAIKAAGATPVAACNYSFPYTDVNSFLQLAAILEGVGIAGYAGVAPLVSSKTLLADGALLLINEAVHITDHRFNLNYTTPGDPFGTALGPNGVWSMLADYTVSCPSSNPPVPFKVYPKMLPAQSGQGQHGGSYNFTTQVNIPSTPWITWISGVDCVSVPATVNGNKMTAKIPTVTEGQVYAHLTNVNTTNLTDDQVVAGPVALQIASGPPTLNYTIL